MVDYPVVLRGTMRCWELIPGLSTHKAAHTFELSPLWDFYFREMFVEFFSSSWLLNTENEKMTCSLQMTQ